MLSQGHSKVMYLSELLHHIAHLLRFAVPKYCNGPTTAFESLVMYKF